MNVNRLISQISTNKLLCKNTLTLSINSLTLNSLLKTSATLSNQFQNDYLKSKQLESNKISLRLNSNGTAAAATTTSTDKSNLEEMNKSLKRMETALQDNILIRQANFKLKHLNFLQEAEKKPTPATPASGSKKIYDAYIDPYVKLFRLNNLAAVHLVYWPSAWAIIGSASYLHTTPDFYMLGLFGLGAIAMRTAGCIINDIWDRNIDKHVERTKERPLASGKVNLPVAVGLLGVNLSAALAVVLQTNLTTQLLAACALFPVAVYPASKRFFEWPQAVLGVTFNWGVLLGWSAILCSNPEVQSLTAFTPALALYAACINWTLFYDTIYAFPDKEFDKKMGLKSLAIYIEKRPTLWLLGFSTLCCSNLALFGWLTNQEPIYYITVGATMLHFIKQLAVVDFKSPQSCMSQFKSNKMIGYLITFGLLASIYIK